MNPAEEIVKFWLQQNGYFYQSSIRVESIKGNPSSRNKEIDILAIHKDGKIKRHIEVSVSIKSVLTRTTLDEAKKKSAKFNHPAVKAETAKIFGDGVEYEKEFVVGNIGKGKAKEYIEKMKDLFDIKVTPMSEVLESIAPKLHAHHQLNPILQTLRIGKEFSDQLKDPSTHTSSHG